MKWFIGTSGFSFDDWVGTVYPNGIKKSEMFTYYWQHYGFNSVELNFTFYTMPSPKTLVNLVRRAPMGFKFSIKIHGSITHDKVLENLPDFFKSCRIVKDEGRLIGYLAQFPYSFKNSLENRDYLLQLIDSFLGEELFIEFRHESWTQWLDNFRNYENVHLVIPDLPKISGLFPLVKSDSKIVYLRLHGRKERWFNADEKTRYDYNYSDEELKGIIPVVFPENLQKAFVFFNNCYRGQALQNAQKFRELVGGEKVGIFF
ncbi:MAG: DUF72 domain-containing protein [Fervidobacterium sp.]